MLMVPMINRGGAPREDDLSGANERMIRDQMVARGIRDERVLGAFRSVPRELFVPHALLSAAFDDSPLPLDRGQTISQPFIVALMTQTLRLQPGHSVLEIGTGSGYQTAVLARLARKVYSAELEPDLARDVQARLDQLAITNVILGVGDGLHIFRDDGPFDAILSAAAPVRLPEELLGQLAEGGRMVIPIGSPDLQYLWLFERRGEEILRRQLDAVRFVPLRT
jgi:protein-L-isoaspartate(D-aspartate) O-methyltransferase